MLNYMALPNGTHLVGQCLVCPYEFKEDKMPNSLPFLIHQNTTRCPCCNGYVTVTVHSASPGCIPAILKKVDDYLYICKDDTVIGIGGDCGDCLIARALLFAYPFAVSVYVGDGILIERNDPAKNLYDNIGADVVQLMNVFDHCGLAWQVTKEEFMNEVNAVRFAVAEK